MKKLYLIACLAFLAGCATVGKPFNDIDSMVKNGDLLSAYKQGILYGEKIKNRNEFVKSIKENEKHYSANKFYSSISESFKSGQKTEHFIVEAAELINFSTADGLIDKSNANILIMELMYLTYVESMSNPKILSSQFVRQALPDLFSLESKNKLFDYKFSQLKGREIVTLSELMVFVDGKITTDDPGKLKDFEIFSDVIASNELNFLLASNKTLTYGEVLPLIKYANKAKKMEINSKLNLVLARVQFTKNELQDSEIASFNIEFVRDLTSRKVKNYRLKIEPEDDVFREDLQNLLKNKNEWLNFSDESSSIMLVKKIRFHENYGNPNNGTEIVPDPSFGTLLTIPKNASVLFDYVSTDFRIDYLIETSVAGLSNRKTIKGSESMKKIECRNVRYQNVFGGVGAVYGYPNERVSVFCESSKNLNFDILKSKVMEEIANQIYTNLK